VIWMSNGYLSICGTCVLRVLRWRSSDLKLGKGEEETDSREE
jgi:hypothetical protein